MIFTYSPELIAYMKSKGKNNIVVEVASVEHTDIDVTELHVHLCSDKDAEVFCSKKRFREVKTDVGKVLLPPYRLEYDEEVFFTLKKLLFISYIKYSGIRL